MKLRVRCGSKCGGSQPRTRRIPPRLAGPTSPARSDAGVDSGPASTAVAHPVFSRSRRLRPKRVRGARWRSSIRVAPFPRPSGGERRPVVNVLEPQRPTEQPLLQGAPDRAFDILSHGPKADGIRIVSEDGRLLLKVLSRKEQVRRLGSPRALV